MAQSTIKTNYAVERVNVALANQSTWTVQKLSVYRWGKLVQVALEASTSNTSVDYVTLATGLPIPQTGYSNAYYHDTGTWSTSITTIGVRYGGIDVRNNSGSKDCKIDTTFVYICE